jgi:hypothetical protein
VTTPTVGKLPRQTTFGIDVRSEGEIPPMEDLLRIYMNDQLALGVGWRELARRAARENRGTQLGAALADVATQIREDVETFEELMRRLGFARDRLKIGAAIATERLGRLKPNGQLRGYSPLSRFVELDLLVMGIEGKVTLWGNLRDLAGLGERLPDVDFDRLVERARAQRALLEPFHATAGHEALGLPATRSVESGLPRDGRATA